MKLVYAKEMNHEQDQNLRLCVSKYKIELTKEDALSIINNQIALVESGVHVLDRRFPVPGSGRVDTIAVDQRNSLLLIGLGSILDIKGISNLFLQADWMTANLDVLRHIYPDRILDNNIRLWYLAGKILPEAESLLKRFDRDTPLELFTYDCVGFSSERWLVIQPYLVKRESLIVDRGSWIDNTANNQRFTINELTQEEIDDFLTEDGHYLVNRKS